jgi:hypothetical protein
MVVEVGNTSNTGALSTIKPAASGVSTKLSIKNLSNSDLFNVRWVGITLPYSRISMGDTVQQEVSVGSAYIYFEFKRKSNSVSARTRDMVTVEEGELADFTFTDTTVIVETGTGNTDTLENLIAAVTGLSIKNQSFSDLLNVQWERVSFASSTLEDSVPVGKTVQQEVSAGSAYIFFKRKTNPTVARTKDPVVVTEGNRTEFIFDNNTEIVEANNPNNSGTLQGMTSTVLFFDDAEGEIQNYAERKNSDYYAYPADLPNYYGYYFSSTYSYNPPYRDTGKSIALGGNADCKLVLSITMTKKGKLSFWFANKSYVNENIGTISIDGVEKASWTGNYSWSYKEFSLEPGNHEIVWTKHSRYNSYYQSYLSLDDILVVLDTE